MRQPTRKHRRQLRRLRRPEFIIEFTAGEILRQLDVQGDAKGRTRGWS